MSRETIRWFIEALRDACNEALKDGMVGHHALDHIEDIEVTDSGTSYISEKDGFQHSSPIMLKVTCFGAYSPTECRRVYENQSIIEVASLVARLLADRGLGLKDSFDDLTQGG